MAFITTDQAKLHLRVDDADEDAVIEIYLGAAESMAVEFINRAVYESAGAMEAAIEAGTAGDYPMVINDGIKGAILLILGHLYVNRSSVVHAVPNIQALPLGSQALLQPFRKGLGV